VARLGSTVNDFSQLLPFLLRTWMYLSGVLFSVLTLSQSAFGKRHHELVALLQLNPAAIYITLIRNSLLLSQRLSAPGSKPANARICHKWPGTAADPHYYASAYCTAVINPDHLWFYAVGWAVVALIIGFVFFWRAEAKYGRG
jgi:teichoic acid transport system permease protein